MSEDASSAGPQLVSLRCPYSRTAKTNGHVYVCGRLIIKASPGSSGEAWCWSCRRRIIFNIEGTAQIESADTDWP